MQSNKPLEAPEAYRPELHQSEFDRILRAQAQLELHKKHMTPAAFSAIRDALKGR